jgi:membrane protease YdiL (CAAX protease family)
MVAALVFGAAAMLAGLVLLVVLLFRWLDGRVVTRYHPPRGGTGPFLEAFALYLAGMAGLAALARLVLGERVPGMWFMVAVLPLACAWPLLRGVGRSELRQGLGLHTGRGLWREVGAGFVGYLATLPVLAAGAVVTLVLQRFSGTDASHPIVGEFGRGGWRTAQLFFLAAVWAPVVEELMFRGAFYHHLRSRMAWPFAAAVVALIFAAIHPQGWVGVPVLAAIAFSFAFIREWRGSIIAPAVAHALNNGAVTLLMVLMLS